VLSFYIIPLKCILIHLYASERHPFKSLGCGRAATQLCHSGPVCGLLMQSVWCRITYTLMGVLEAELNVCVLVMLSELQVTSLCMPVFQL
jgi:hypothetical protein